MIPSQLNSTEMQAEYKGKWMVGPMPQFFLKHLSGRHSSAAAALVSWCFFFFFLVEMQCSLSFFSASTLEGRPSRTTPPTGACAIIIFLQDGDTKGAQYVLLRPPSFIYRPAPPIPVGAIRRRRTVSISRRSQVQSQEPCRRSNSEGEKKVPATGFYDPEKDNCLLLLPLLLLWGRMKCRRPATI